MIKLFQNHFEVFGPSGGISTRIYMPKGQKSVDDKYHLVIIMHGFMASKNRKPVSSIAKMLSNNGYAVLTFDFDAHGKSEGKFIDMTISSEIADAKSVFDYACGLPFVKDISFVGHSQGGVIAGMLAGQLEDADHKPKCLVQLAPAAVLKDDAIAGKCMFSKYDASNPPEYVNVFFHKLGRKFILEAQKLDIIGSSGKYSGNVCLIHGDKDKIVPSDYSGYYHDAYLNSELHLIKDETHFFNKKVREVDGIILDFLKKNLQ